MYKVSVPGSLVLLGEHGVLNNQPALGLAVDKRIYLTLTPRRDRTFHIHSAIGEHRGHLDAVQILEPFQYVLSMIAQHKTFLRQGFDLEIESQFSHLLGFGSSTAVTLGTGALLQNWLLKERPAEPVLFNLCHSVIKSVQEQASGLDIASSLLGGLVYYQTKPLRFEKLHPPQLPYPEMFCIYSGQKVPTHLVLEHLRVKNNQVEALVQHLYQNMGQCSHTGLEAIQQGDWPRLGRIMDMQQGLLNALGVSTLALEHIVDIVRRSPQVMGAKISGAGLGDSVLVLGTSSHSELQVALKELPHCTLIPFGISDRGLDYA